MMMIQAHNLSRLYGPTLAVDGLSFELPANTLAALLGPNGAGKSTTLRMLTGTLPPTRGKAAIAGFDVQDQSFDARRNLGYLPESTPLYPELRVTEYLHFRGKLLGMAYRDRKRRIGELLDRCGLAALHQRTIGRLSRGNRQRLGIAQALLHEPPVLILDEPTASLDPTQVAALRDLLRELKERHTILLSSHILPEVEQTADVFLIVAGGRLVAQGSAEQLRQQGGSTETLKLEAATSVAGLRAALAGVETIEMVNAHDDAGWCVATLHCQGDAQRGAEAVGRTLASQGVALRALNAGRPSLEEVFVHLTAATRIEPPAEAAA